MWGGSCEKWAMKFEIGGVSDGSVSSEGLSCLFVLPRAVSKKL